MCKGPLRFYAGVLGLEIMQRYGDGAIFLSANIEEYTRRLDLHQLSQEAPEGSDIPSGPRDLQIDNRSSLPESAVSDDDDPSCLVASIDAVLNCDA